MKRYSLAILGLIILLIPVEYGNAQEHPVKFDLVAGSNGIFLGKINGITRDKHGVLWLSDQTNRCVTRYDGTQMTRYQMDSKNPDNSLGGTYPEIIAVDSTGIIWIGFYGMGLDRFDQESNSFTHFRHMSNDAGSLANDTISALLVDHLGNLWIGTNAGLDLLDPKTGTFKHFNHNVNDPSSLSYNIVRALYEDREGALWVGTGFVFDPNIAEGGLNRFDRKTETFTRYLNNPKDQHSLISNKVRAIFEDSKGNFWVGTDGDGLHTMDRRTGLFERHLYNPAKPDQLSRPAFKGGFDHITFITEDIENNIWIGTYLNGLNRYNPETKKITHFGGDGDKTTGFKDRSCWGVNTSDDGLLWISTQEDNLYRVNLFTNIFHLDTVQGGGVSTFYEESGAVMWLGTDNGLVRRDVKNGLSKIFTNDIQNPNSLSNNYVNCTLKDKGGNFWIGTGSGLNRYNPSSENFSRFLQDPDNPESISGEFVVSLFEDSESTLWIGTNKGLNSMNKRAGKFSHYRKDPADSNSISDNLALCFLEDHPNDLWIGTGNGGGINRMNPKTGKFRHYLRGANITAIYRDPDSIIWVGTTNGLYQYDRTSDNFLDKSENNSALNINNVVSIVGDDQNNLWIGAFSGIFRINNRRDMVIYYGKENGIGSQVLYYGSAYKGKDGKLFFGGNDGYYSFYPDKLKISQHLPKVQFSRLWINGQAVQATSDGPLKKPLNNTEEIHLNYDQNVVSLSFSAVDYSNTNNQILYKLENYDEDWRKPGSEGRAYYFNLPAGKYKFRIRAANSNNGIWQEKELRIVISPPWWSTWWAYCMYGLLFTGLLYAIHRVQKARLIKAERERTRLRELAQAKEIEKAYNELRMTQSQLIQAEKMASLGELTAGIAHEIQNPLNFVNNFSEVNKELIDELHEEELKQDRNPDVIVNLLTNLNQNLEKISFHGKRADSIVKGMLQHSRTGSGIKEPTNINALADEYLRLSYHGLRAKDNSFNATMKTDFDESIGQVSIIPQDIGRVFLNLFNNAFYASQLRSEGGQRDPAHQHLPTIWVNTKKDGNKVFISVRDNGPGIPKKILDKIFQPFFTTKPTGQGTGLGLSLSYDIIKAHGGEIKVETKEGEGSTFIIQIPL